MTKERKIKFYTSILIGYLLIYGGVRLFSIISLFSTGNSWLILVYFMGYGLHLPLMFIGGLLTFLGKKRQSATVWFWVLLCFILSNGWWLYMFLASGGIMVGALLSMLTTVIPIFASLQLFRLTKTPADSL